MRYRSLDLFCGGGGLSEGMKKAGFDVRLGVDVDEFALQTFQLNNPKTLILKQDVRQITGRQITSLIGPEQIHLLAGCPPCQGFSSIRKLNRCNVRDKRNSLITDFIRIIAEVRPTTVMLENVPGIMDYYLFPKALNRLRDLGYQVDYDVLDVKDFGVPQTRKRFILVGSLLGPITIAAPTFEKMTVRQAIGHLEATDATKDPVHKTFTRHCRRIQELISLIPKNGGSRKDLPPTYILDCHKKINVGFADVYGRLSWNKHSVTITGGCLNPSKGRFLHPEENRVITGREAALLQGFPDDFKFPIGIPKKCLANIIGEAIPPKFSQIQSLNIQKHLELHQVGYI